MVRKKRFKKQNLVTKLFSGSKKERTMLVAGFLIGIFALSFITFTYFSSDDALTGEAWGATKKYCKIYCITGENYVDKLIDDYLWDEESIVSYAEGFGCYFHEYYGWISGINSYTGNPQACTMSHMYTYSSIEDAIEELNELYLKAAWAYTDNYPRGSYEPSKSDGIEVWKSIKKKKSKYCTVDYRANKMKQKCKSYGPSSTQISEEWSSYVEYTGLSLLYWGGSYQGANAHFKQSADGNYESGDLD